MITSVTKLHNLGSIQSFFFPSQKILVIIIILVIYCNCKERTSFWMVIYEIMIFAVKIFLIKLLRETETC